MKHANFISRLEESRILAAVRSAEDKTTGKIRVMISKQSFPNALAAAEKHFKILKLDRSSEHNTVLIFVAPRSQTFAIYGDGSAHARLGPEFWNILRDEMAAQLKDSRYTDALLHAIAKAGDLLAVHFPRDEPGPCSKRE